MNAEPKTAPHSQTPHAELVRALLEDGWTPADDDGHPQRVLRPADASGLTLRLTPEAGGTLLLQLKAKRRRLSDGTVRPPWRAEVYGTVPVEVLTAVAAAHAADCGPDTWPAVLLVPAGWVQLGHGFRDWTAPDQQREVVWIDDDPDNTDLRWCVQRYDLETEISIADDAPASVIAAFALTDTADGER